MKQSISDDIDSLIAEVDAQTLPQEDVRQAILTSLHALKTVTRLYDQQINAMLDRLNKLADSMREQPGMQVPNQNMKRHEVFKKETYAASYCVIVNDLLWHWQTVNGVSLKSLTQDNERIKQRLLRQRDTHRVTAGIFSYLHDRSLFGCETLESSMEKWLHAVMKVHQADRGIVRVSRVGNGRTYEVRLDSDFTPTPEMNDFIATHTREALDTQDIVMTDDKHLIGDIPNHPVQWKDYPIRGAIFVPFHDDAGAGVAYLGIPIVKRVFVPEADQKRILNAFCAVLLGYVRQFM